MLTDEQRRTLLYHVRAMLNDGREKGLLPEQVVTNLLIEMHGQMSYFTGRSITGREYLDYATSVMEDLRGGHK